ncbi:hypothetical protein K523DRAFT_324076 [Schizophyllum commune Tattone D]|nr:hypothetical protein K523DRAFT_324076 [Schizophyllum commune Tattone D]
MREIKPRSRQSVWRVRLARHSDKCGSDLKCCHTERTYAMQGQDVKVRLSRPTSYVAQRG